MKVTKVSEKYQLSKGKYTIYLTNEQGFWTATTYSGNEKFVFVNDNSQETREKWSTIATLIKRATKLMEGE